MCIFLISCAFSWRNFKFWNLGFAKCIHNFPPIFSPWPVIIKVYIHMYISKNHNNFFLSWIWRWRIYKIHRGNSYWRKYLCRRCRWLCRYYLLLRISGYSCWTGYPLWQIRIWMLRILWYSNYHAFSVFFFYAWRK